MESRYSFIAQGLYVIGFAAMATWLFAFEANIQFVERVLAVAGVACFSLPVVAEAWYRLRGLLANKPAS